MDIREKSNTSKFAIPNFKRRHGLKERNLETKFALPRSAIKIPRVKNFETMSNENIKMIVISFNPLYKQKWWLHESQAMDIFTNIQGFLSTRVIKRSNFITTRETLYDPFSTSYSIIYPKLSESFGETENFFPKSSLIEKRLRETSHGLLKCNSF